MRRLKMYNATRNVVVETRNKGREARDTMDQCRASFASRQMPMNFGRVALGKAE